MTGARCGLSAGSAHSVGASTGGGNLPFSTTPETRVWRTSKKGSARTVLIWWARIPFVYPKPSLGRTISVNVAAACRNPFSPAFGMAHANGPGFINSDGIGTVSYI